MSPEDFGYNYRFEKFRIDNHLDIFEMGRVIAEHKERYIVSTTKGEFESEITGNMRYTAKSREDFPAAGDWVAMIIYDNDLAIIHKIFPRFSIIKRQAVSKSVEIQVIAANIDFAFLVQAIDRDFNINRLERYLTICNPAIPNVKTEYLNLYQTDNHEIILTFLPGFFYCFIICAIYRPRTSFIRFQTH